MISESSAVITSESPHVTTANLQEINIETSEFKTRDETFISGSGESTATFNTGILLQIALEHTAGSSECLENTHALKGF